MATKLEVYNNVLTLLGARTLATVSDARSERRSLDRVYDPALQYLIEAALWHFAAVTHELSPSDTTTSEFGYNYVYEKPDDYVRIIKISDNERFTPTLEDYSEELDFFLCDAQPIWLQYVSNDITAGADPGKWSASFTAAFVDELAYRAATQIAGVSVATKDWLEKKRRRSLYYAKGKSAVNQAMGHLPIGRLIRSRAGSQGVNKMRRTPYT